MCDFFVIALLVIVQFFKFSFCKHVQLSCTYLLTYLVGSTYSRYNKGRAVPNYLSMTTNKESSRRRWHVTRSCWCGRLHALSALAVQSPQVAVLCRVLLLENVQPTVNTIVPSLTRMLIV